MSEWDTIEFQHSSSHFNVRMVTLRTLSSGVYGLNVVAEASSSIVITEYSCCCNGRRGGGQNPLLMSSLGEPETLCTYWNTQIPTAGVCVCVCARSSYFKSHFSAHFSPSSMVLTKLIWMDEKETVREPLTKWAAENKEGKQFDFTGRHYKLKTRQACNILLACLSTFVTFFSSCLSEICFSAGLKLTN